MSGRDGAPSRRRRARRRGAARGRSRCSSRRTGNDRSRRRDALDTTYRPRPRSRRARRCRTRCARAAARAPPHSATCAAMTRPSPAARAGSVTGLPPSLAYGFRCGCRAHPRSETAGRRDDEAGPAPERERHQRAHRRCRERRRQLGPEPRRDVADAARHDERDRGDEHERRARLVVRARDAQSVRGRRRRWRRTTAPARRTDRRRVVATSDQLPTTCNNSAQTRSARVSDTVRRHARCAASTITPTIASVSTSHGHHGPGATQARSPCTTTGRPSTVSGTDHCDALNEPVPM